MRQTESVDAFFGERVVPGEDVIVDAVDEGPVEIEQECDGPAHHRLGNVRIGAAVPSDLGR